MIARLQRKMLLKTVTVVGLSFVLWNCSTTGASVISAESNPAEHDHMPEWHAMKVAVLLDQSGSRTWTRTPKIEPPDLSPLIDLVKTRGGEIGFGLIRDESNRSLVRLRIDQPPLPPQPPTETENAFVLLEKRAQYQKQLASYREKRASWDSSTQPRIDKFLSSIEPLVGFNGRVRASDVWGAIRRADLFLAEDDAAWGGAARRWALLVTDGDDNVGRPLTEFASGAQIVVVNGSGSTGDLTRLNPIAFESLDGALRYLIAEEGFHERL